MGDLFTDDGVLIQERGEVRTIAGWWTTYIVIDAPTRPDTAAWGRILGDGMKKIEDHVSADDYMAWQARLNALDEKRDIPRLDEWENVAPASVTAPTGDLRRVRRGLFDFVGKLSKSLFGTATVEDLRVLQEAMHQTRQGMSILHHNTKEMLSLINQTRMYVRENRLDLRRLVSETVRLTASAEINAKKTHALELQVGRLAVQRQIDLTLQRMELAIRDFRLQQRIFHRQKLQLERGWLTEDILPPRALNRILRKLRTQGYHTLPSEWYYEYVHVFPTWGNTTELTYKSIIPALSTSHYLRYVFRYFDVPIGSHHLRRIIGREDLAINTVTGATFVLTDCIGDVLSACRPVYEDLQDTCESSLVLRHSAEGCRVAVSRRDNQTTRVFPSINQDHVIVIAYAPSEVALRCNGQAARRWTISGPTQVTVPGGCTLESEGWRVSGAGKGHSTLHVAPPAYVRVPSLNLTWPKLITPQVQKRLDFQDRVEVPLVGWELSEDGSDLPPVKELHRPSLIGYPVGSGLLLMCLVIAFTGYKVCRRWNQEEPREAPQPSGLEVPDSCVTTTPKGSHVPIGCPYRSNTDLGGCV